MDKKIWIILASIFCCLTLIFIILVIVLPIERKKDAEADAKDHSTPAKDNIYLWATFPGELKTQTTHTFKILEYQDDSSASVKDSIKLSENIYYEEFEYPQNQIKFLANSTYKIVADKTSQKNQKIKTLSLGLFETLETLSKSDQYQQGINSIELLIRKAFQSPETFINHLFSYRQYISLTPEKI